MPPVRFLIGALIPLMGNPDGVMCELLPGAGGLGSLGGPMARKLRAEYAGACYHVINPPSQ